MSYKLNDRFELSSDNYCWILTDHSIAKGKKHYFTQFDQLSRFLLGLLAKNSLPSQRHELDEIVKLTQSYDALIKHLEVELSNYLTDVTQGMNYQDFYRHHRTNTMVCSSDSTEHKAGKILHVKKDLSRA